MKSLRLLPCNTDCCIIASFQISGEILERLQTARIIEQMPKPVTSSRLLSSRMHFAQLYVLYFYTAASTGSSFILSSPQTSVMHHPSAPGCLYVTHSRNFQLCWNLKGPLPFEQFFADQNFTLYTTAFLFINKTLTQD